MYRTEFVHQIPSFPKFCGRNAHWLRDRQFLERNAKHGRISFLNVFTLFDLINDETKLHWNLLLSTTANGNQWLSKWQVRTLAKHCHVKYNTNIDIWSVARVSQLKKLQYEWICGDLALTRCCCFSLFRMSCVCQAIIANLEAESNCNEFNRFFKYIFYGLSFCKQKINYNVISYAYPIGGVHFPIELSTKTSNKPFCSCKIFMNC